MAPDEPAPELDDPKAAIRRLLIARNASAVRRLAEDRGLSDEELARIAREVLAEQQEVNTEDRLGERYDIHTGRYLSLEEFVDHLLGEG
ncbi:MAG: hypothetical protein ACLF0G_06405 [Candidatus Brocadiia bacterium]